MSSMVALCGHSFAGRSLGLVFRDHPLIRRGALLNVFLFVVGKRGGGRGPQPFRMLFSRESATSGKIVDLGFLS